MSIMGLKDHFGVISRSNYPLFRLVLPIPIGKSSPYNHKRISAYADMDI